MTENDMVNVDHSDDTEDDDVDWSNATLVTCLVFVIVPR